MFISGRRSPTLKSGRWSDRVVRSQIPLKTGHRPTQQTAGNALPIHVRQFVKKGHNLFSKVGKEWLDNRLEILGMNLKKNYFIFTYPQFHTARESCFSLHLEVA
ncbi:MAG: hypothetical protein A2Y79_08110 [Deltaproteobacteria bacterium RBG_13_43_22]|nr:MAG: hypothetical protein A2Y79_08110 [Deltaproteobacteria bacterium RBG_13_43_22]